MPKNNTVKVCPVVGVACHYKGCMVQKGCVRKNPNMVRIVARLKGMREPSPSKTKPVKGKRK